MLKMFSDNLYYLGLHILDYLKPTLDTKNLIETM